MDVTYGAGKVGHVATLSWCGACMSVSGVDVRVDVRDDVHDDVRVDVRDDVRDDVLDDVRDYVIMEKFLPAYAPDGMSDMYRM